jgi:hypothetical protein
MKASSAVAVFGLQVSLAATSWQFCAAQNPLAALENEAKEKAAEVALTKVLNDNLPLTLDAKDVYPTVTTLPGGPFSPTPLKLTADQLDQPLPPGDYTINTLDFCSQYSIHEPGAGLAYVLGPYEGKAAGAIGALIWRGTEQYGINPQSLQAVSWTIQSGLTYDQMPKSYQAIVDQVIPDYKSEITGDFVTNIESTYNSLAKAASLPPLDTILAKLGAPGQLALDAERQRQILTAQNTNDQIKEQTLFQGQESGIYTPVKAETGPWTERVAGQVYMKLLIAGGNMATNNVMQIRVMPSPTANAQVQRNGLSEIGKPHLARASYGEPQATPAVDNAPITLTNLMEGMLGYAVGQGAQALGQVAVVLKALNPLAVTPAEADEGPKPAAPAPAPTAPEPPASPEDLAAITPAAGGAAQTGPATGTGCVESSNKVSRPLNIAFTSYVDVVPAETLYAAYQRLYQAGLNPNDNVACKYSFAARMNAIAAKGTAIVLYVLDAKDPHFDELLTRAKAAYQYAQNTHPSLKLQVPSEYEYAMIIKIDLDDSKSKKAGNGASNGASNGTSNAAASGAGNGATNGAGNSASNGTGDQIYEIVISLQALMNGYYQSQSLTDNDGAARQFIKGAALPVPIAAPFEMPMAYELGTNAYNKVIHPDWCEEMVEDDTDRFVKAMFSKYAPNSDPDGKTGSMTYGDMPLPSGTVPDWWPPTSLPGGGEPGSPPPPTILPLRLHGVYDLQNPGVYGPTEWKDIVPNAESVDSYSNVTGQLVREPEIYQGDSSNLAKCTAPPNN